MVEVSLHDRLHIYLIISRELRKNLRSNEVALDVERRGVRVQRNVTLKGGIFVENGGIVNFKERTIQ